MISVAYARTRSQRSSRVTAWFPILDAADEQRLCDSYCLFSYRLPRIRIDLHSRCQPSYEPRSGAPVFGRTSDGTSSICIRTGTRWARRADRRLSCECIGGIGLLLLRRCREIGQRLPTPGLRRCVLRGRFRLFDRCLGKAHADLIIGRVDDRQ